MTRRERLRRRGFVEAERGEYFKTVDGVLVAVFSDCCPSVCHASLWPSFGPRWPAAKSIYGRNVVDLAQRASAAARRLAGRKRE